MFRRPILLLMLAAFLPLAALSVALGIATLRAERDKIERDAVDRVRRLSAALARDLTGQLDVLRVLAQSRDFDDGVTPEEFSEFTRRVKQEMPGWLTLRFTDPAAKVLADGQLVPGAEGATSPQIVDIESHRYTVEAKRPVIGRVLRGSLGRHAFALRAPVIRDGEAKYVISAVITPDSIRDRFLVPGLPAHWIATVIDGAGNVAARSSGPATLIGAPASAAAREARASGVEGIYPGFVLEGVPTISAFHMLPIGNWSVHVGVPRDVFMAPLQRSLWLIGAGLATTLVLAAIFLWLLLREVKLRRQEELGMAPAAPKPEEAVQSGGNKGRILLVEDNLAVAEVTAAMLSDAGYDVTRRASAAAGLDLLNRNRDFDVLLSDIVMDEGISGLDLARHVRAMWPELPVVLMTGFSEALKGPEFVEIPVVFKPFTQQEILEALQQVQGREAVAG